MTAVASCAAADAVIAACLATAAAWEAEAVERCSSSAVPCAYSGYAHVRCRQMHMLSDKEDMDTDSIVSCVCARTHIHNAEKHMHTHPHIGS